MAAFVSMGGALIAVILCWKLVKFLEPLARSNAFIFVVLFLFCLIVGLYNAFTEGDYDGKRENYNYKNNR